eukprot:COSAG04_NODE_1581_length_6253_cov_23.444899_3_plen_92_part_00
MTLIAPIDTGAWEGECNRTNNQQQSAPEDAKVCAVLKNQSACNADDPAHAVCDWRLTTKPKPVIRTIIYGISGLRFPKVSNNSDDRAGRCV